MHFGLLNFKRIVIAVLISTTVSSGSFAFSSENQSKKLLLWYKQPGVKWTDALPVGNGRLGAMVFGGVKNERVQLNEDTLWAGPAVPEIREGAHENYAKAREAVFAGNHAEAEEIIEKKVLGERIVPRSYQTLGDLHLDFKVDPAKVKNYTRSLDLETAIAKTEFEIEGVKYNREVFSSVGDDVIVVHLGADKKNMISVDVRLDRPCDFEVVAMGSGGLRMFGQASHEGEHKGARYNCRLRARIKGGKVSSDGGQLKIENADSVTIYISAATDLNRDDPYDRLKIDLNRICDEQIKQAANRDYEDIRKEHIAKHQELFGRVGFDLGGEILAERPTDERLEAVKQGKEDLGLVAMYFQFGRYLLMCSSRPGNMAANLQGIWNDKIEAPWNADYHININIQMNYWVAEVCNLSECHGPFFDLIERLVPSGRKTAKEIYGCRGFVAHHTTDPWLWTAPIGKCLYGMWPLGGGWSVQHFMEHYRFTGDKEFLKKRALPIIREAAVFFLDYLVEDAKTSKLVAGPASSPENYFINDKGEIASVDMGCAMSQEVIWDTFTNYLEAVEILGVEDELTDKIRKARGRLAMPQIGSDGRLLEWAREYKEHEPGHRHVSHLYGLHPGRQFTFESTPDYMQACRKTIEYRLSHGGGHTGWSRAWIINFWARLGDSENVYKNIQALLAKSTLDNLFNTHPPFQIDGNFGATAGIAEALLQSHEGRIVLLPALPKQWDKGSITGLIARGNFSVDIEWESAKLKKAAITSNNGNKCRVSYGGVTAEFDTVKGETIILNSGLEKYVF